MKCDACNGATKVKRYPTPGHGGDILLCEDCFRNEAGTTPLCTQCASFSKDGNVRIVARIADCLMYDEAEMVCTGHSPYYFKL